MLRRDEMKDGDRVVIAYNLKKLTRSYFPSDKIATRFRVGNFLDSCHCVDPKIMFPKVFYTAELKWSEN